MHVAVSKYELSEKVINWNPYWSMRLSNKMQYVTGIIRKCPQFQLDWMQGSGLIEYYIENCLEDFIMRIWPSERMLRLLFLWIYFLCNYQLLGFLIHRYKLSYWCRRNPFRWWISYYFNILLLKHLYWNLPLYVHFLYRLYCVYSK